MVDKGEKRENCIYSIIVHERESVIVIKKIYLLFMKYELLWELTSCRKQLEK